MSVLAATRTFAVTDPAGRDLGRVRVESVEDRLVLGDFDPGPDYPAVEPVFRHFAEVVEQQSFSYLDAAEAAVAAIGVAVRADGEGEPVPVSDVQIYPDGGASFRLPPAFARNGRSVH